MVNKKLKRRTKKVGRFLKKVVKAGAKEAKTFGRGIASVPEIKSATIKVKTKIKRFRIEPPTTKRKRRSGAQRKKKVFPRRDPFTDVLSTIKNL